MKTKTNEFDELKKLGYEYYKKEESEENKFISIPKQFYVCPFYREYLTPTTRELYAWLKDRMSLSEKTTNEGSDKFVDDNGYIYLVFTREDIGKKLGIAKQTVSDGFKILSILGLIYEKRLGQGFSNRIYIGKVKYLTNAEALKFIDVTEQNEWIIKMKAQKSKKQTSENQTSKSKESRTLEVRKVGTINTDTTKTDIIKTNLVVDVEPKPQEELIKLFEDNICTLKPVVKEKFIKAIEMYSYDFLKALVTYCVSIGTYSYAGFETALNEFIKSGVDTPEKLETAINQYRESKTKKKTVKTSSAKGNNKKSTFITEGGENYMKTNESIIDLLEKSHQSGEVFSD